MSKKKSTVILVSTLIMSYFLSGVVYVFIFDQWSVRTILSLVTSFCVFLLVREYIKNKYPSTYEEFEIDQKDERNTILRYQATYYGFFSGVVILMFVGALLYDVGHPQAQNGVMLSLSILLLTQVFGYVFVHFKNRT
jgi:hypothetical protein